MYQKSFQEGYSTIEEQLRRENEILRRNENDYQELHLLLTSLEQKYSTVADEKRILETELLERHGKKDRLLASLKSETSTLTETLAKKQRQLDDANAEISACKDIAEHKQINTDRIKVELKASFEENLKLKESNSSLESQVQRLSEEKRQLGLRVELLTKQEGELKGQRDAFSKELNESEKANRILQTSNSNLQVELTVLREEDQRKSALVKELQIQSSLVQEQVQNLDEIVVSNNAELDNNRLEAEELRMSLHCLRKELFDKEEHLNRAFKELKELQQNHTNLLHESQLLKEANDSLEQRCQKAEEARVRVEDTMHKFQVSTDAALLEAKEQIIHYESVTKRMDREVCEKDEFIAVMDESSANALQTILKLETDLNKSTIDLTKLKREFDAVNLELQTELKSNTELLRSNGLLEEMIYEKSAQIEELEKERVEQKEFSDDMADQVRSLKKEVVVLRQQLDGAQHKQSLDQAQIEQLQETVLDLEQQKEQLLKDISEQSDALKFQSQELEVKEQLVEKIEEQGRVTLANLVKVQADHKRQSLHNETLTSKCQEKTIDLESANENIQRITQELRQVQDYATTTSLELQRARKELRESVEEKQLYQQDIDRLRRDNLDFEVQYTQLQETMKNREEQEKLLREINERKREAREARIREEQLLKQSLYNLNATFSTNKNRYSGQTDDHIKNTDSSNTRTNQYYETASQLPSRFFGHTSQ